MGDEWGPSLRQRGEMGTRGTSVGRLGKLEDRILKHIRIYWDIHLDISKCFLYSQWFSSCSWVSIRKAFKDPSSGVAYVGDLMFRGHPEENLDEFTANAKSDLFHLLCRGGPGTAATVFLQGW